MDREDRKRRKGREDGSILGGEGARKRRKNRERNGRERKGHPACLVLLSKS